MTEAIDRVDGQQDQPRSSRRPGKRRAPGRPRALDHETVVRTAVQIADTDGVAALTMARLASELGVAVMTLYTYIPTKDQLLDEVIDAVLGQATLPIPPEEPALWREVLLDTFVEFHDVMLAHWKLVETVGTRTSVGPAVTGWLEAVLRVLEATGFNSQERVAIYRELVSYMLGDLQMRISHLPGLQTTSAVSDAGAEPEFPLVEETIKLVNQQVTREHFALGLRRILDAAPEPASAGGGRVPSRDGSAAVLADAQLQFGRLLGSDQSGTEAVSELVPAGTGPSGQLPAIADEADSAPVALRENAVQMVNEVRENYETETAAIRSVAGKLGLSQEILAKWVTRARVGEGTLPAPDTDELAELHYLRTENQELRRANEILKTASAFFAAELDRPQWRW